MCLKTNALKPLATERLAKRHRKAMHKQVDALVKRKQQPYGGNWIAGNGYQPGPKVATTLGVIAVLAVILVNCVLAARCFDATVSQASRLPKSPIFLTTNDHQ